MKSLNTNASPIDFVGATTFTVAVTSFLIALTEVGSGSSTVLIGATGILCLSTIAFVFQERRARNPMVSFALWSRRPIAATNGVSLLAGMALMGLTTFVPIYVQLVLHRSPVVAGSRLDHHAGRLADWCHFGRALIPPI